MQPPIKRFARRKFSVRKWLCYVSEERGGRSVSAGARVRGSAGSDGAQCGGGQPTLPLTSSIDFCAAG